MASKVKPIPDGYNSVTPYLVVDGAAAAIDFYKTVFNATEHLRIPGPNNRVGHAELMIGSSMIMLADEHPEMNIRGPKKIGGSPISIMLYVPDVDAVAAKAVAAGASLKRPVANQFYGDRMGTIEDPFGHSWHVATHVEDVPPAELERRMKEAGKA
ncbi:MAG TPA: VOC family protein [Dongiaceae bacterium]|nr:VOC family protein [Dongiaceae bacterium]